MSEALEIAQTADEAFDRYKAAFDADALIQGTWHKRNGKDLACALGVLGPNLSGTSDCPASVMPRWLAQHTVWFFDNQPFDDAKAWGLSFYAELKRLNGVVPFSVVHDWQATVVGPLAIETAELCKLDPSLPKAVQALHVRALAGDLAPRTEWFEALRPAYKQVYAYANADADADAYADAYAYAYAYADADAYAYADADADAYADANAYAYADAYAYRLRVKLLADGMVECLRRVPTPVAA